MEAPIILNPVPPQVVNEQAAYGPFNLHDFILCTDGSEVRFRAELQSGQALPKGLICTSDGMVTGIPAVGTQGHYEIKIIAENEAGTIEATMVLTIKPSLLGAMEPGYIDKLKAQVWEAVEHQLPIPDLTELYSQQVTEQEVYYLMERWALLKMWDAYNLEPPGACVSLDLAGASKHYHVFDRGSCLVAIPKDLFSHERTLEDGLQTARAMAREVYKRSWTVEFVGLQKLSRAAWVELQHLSDQYGKRLEVINYEPTPDDYKIYAGEAEQRKPRGGGI